ncbi:unnamed protein product [Penicillium salamii]|uniref:Uncharacterized protein n=1 Tax=Penicillium salamii TaxID=1612424 RepID=A0A9W4I3V4_9EURO|nr:unnamed protein product [Penicillium salamii]CAG7971360.1 unnamed protein product [Penicillium salamii]CAG7988146.1 unnamed protein product [Penicillium salamii]CAG7992237.1 unnamed protein product [Penicillium salamii]CAG7997704.1 unnamed protein product [Penicillium salamii]
MRMNPRPGCFGTVYEFDRLKALSEISLNSELVAFLDKAESSLRSRGHFKQRDCYKRSLLHYAAMGNCTTLLRHLLHSKPSIDSRDQWGRTPLSWAAEYGSLAVAKILLEQGANVNALDYEDCSPLTYLIHAANPEIGRHEDTKAYFIERGAKEGKLRGIKLAWVWVLTYSHLLRHVRPRI